VAFNAAVQDDVARGELYAYPIMRPPLTNSLSCCATPNRHGSSGR
jgi:hypothetical protein